MNFQRILLLFVVLLAAGLAGSFYMNWKTLGQLRTVKAFVEGSVFADAVGGLREGAEHHPVQMDRRQADRRDRPELGQARTRTRSSPSYTLVADSVFCDYDPVKKKADIGSNFLEREILGSIDSGCVSFRMASEEAARIIDLYQRKASGLDRESRTAPG